MFGKARLTFCYCREFELLASCIRQFLGKAADGQVVIAEDVDWDAFIRLAVRHRVIPQLHEVLRRGTANVPSSVIQQIAELQTQIVAGNLRLAAELVRIARLFESRAIPVVAFKGPALAMELYGGLQRRQFIDLDVLIQPDDLLTAITLLDELGYQACGVELARMSAGQRNRVLVDSKSCEMTRSDAAPLHVDLHWRLSNDEALFATVLENQFSGAYLTISGQRILTMPTRELVCYLAFHGGNHRWMRLSWLCDLAAAAQRVPAEEWPLLLSEAERSKTHRYVVSGLLLLERLQLLDAPSRTDRDNMATQAAFDGRPDGTGAPGPMRRYRS